MQQKLTKDTQPDHKNGRKLEPTSLIEKAGENEGVVGLPGGPLGANGDGSLDMQAERLADVRLQRAQRHTLAVQIGQAHGNLHLQHVIQAATRKGSAPQNRNKSWGDGHAQESPSAGEITDGLDGSGTGGPLTFAGSGVPPNGNGTNGSGSYRHIQRQEDGGAEDHKPTKEERARALAAARAADQVANQAKSTGKAETAKSLNAESVEAQARKTAKARAEQTSAEAQSQKGKGKEAVKGARSTKQSIPPGKNGKSAEAQAPLPEGEKEPAAGEKAPTSPEEDPAFQAVATQVRGAGAHQRSHAPASSKVAEAHAASVPPANEMGSKAQANQVGEMDQAQTPAFDAKAFKAQLMQRIQALAPKSMKEADEFKEQDKLRGMKGEMQTKVGQEKSASQDPLKKTTEAAPDPSGIAPKEVSPIPEAGPGAAPKDISAQGAAPKSKATSEVEKPFRESSQSIDQEMSKADVTEEQLANSNEPEFQSALDSKREAQTSAAQAPQDYRSFEGEQVNQAKSEATGTAQAQLQAMHGDRAALLKQVMGHQVGAKTQDETARAKVAGDIQRIYDKTKSNVERILAKLDTDVDKAFDEGAGAAKAAFENYVDAKMEAYKEDRYGGWFGWARWAKDKLLGMPGEVNAFYTEGRNLFIQKMDAVINNIVAIVGRGLSEAKAEVANGKKEIQTYVENLPADLRKVGDQAANEIQGKFDELESSIDSKQNELIERLATKYNEKLKAIDARIEELKAANQGLVDKAINAVVGVVKAILRLKDLLLNALARIADVVTRIIKDPIGFLGNLISGIKLGLENFLSNLPKHLLNALVAWLTGALGPLGIKLPDDLFSLEGIFSLVMQILGLTWDAIRAKAVKLLGEPVVKALETGFEIFRVLISEGPIGLWKYIKEMFSNLKEMVIDAIKDMIETEVVQAGIKWIMGLLTPAGAFIKAAMAIYDIVKFFIERASQIGSLISAIIEGVAAIAGGAIGGAAKLIEDALAKALPIVIGFLANLLGIGDLAKKVQGIVEKIRAKVDKGIEWVIMKAKAVAGKVTGKAGISGEEAEEGKETPKSGRVKANALNEANRRLRHLPRADLIPVKLKEVERIYQPQGLLSLTLEQNETSGIVVVARASDPERRTISWDEVLDNSGTKEYQEAQRAFASSKEPGKEGKRNAPTVAAMVTVDGQAMGPPLWNQPGGPHAEDRAIAEQWPVAMDRARAAVAEKRHSKVVFAISATPCGRCSANLQRIKREAQDELGEPGQKYVKFILAPRSLYEGSYLPHEGKEPAKTGTSARNLIELTDVGWDIRQFAARNDLHPSRRFFDVPLAEYAHYLWRRVMSRSSK